MRIGVDVRCLMEGRKTGVEEYTTNLLDNLFEIDKKNKYLLFLNSFSKKEFDAERFKKYRNVEIKKFRFPNKILNFLFWYFGWPKIDKMLGGAEVLFFPNIIFAASSRKAKILITVHDLSFEIYPQTFSLKKRLWHAFINPKKICRWADRIIAVSESTKNDLFRIYGISPEKVGVISSAASDNFQVFSRNDDRLIKVKEKYGLPYKFILFFGTIEPRKNITALIEAYNQMRSRKNPELEKYKLVIAGYPGWKNKEIYRSAKNSPYSKDILFTGRIEDEDKIYLYNLASIFVYPSFFEGFGFPALEAMKCGVPVIVSNTSSLPEVVGKAAILIDPDRPDEISRALEEILLGSKLKQKLVESGLEQAGKFSWRRSAQKTLEEMQKLVVQK